MRVAIVGCGQIYRLHMGALQELTGVEIAAVCDRDKWRAREAATASGGAEAYSDLETLLRNERPDAVHILTPPTTHAELATQALEAGCHALVEKPFALSVREADSIIEAARRNGVQLCANHNYLFKPSVRKARSLVQSGAIGQVVYVHTYHGLSGERGSYEGTAGRSHWARHLPGGAFTNFLPHLIYLQLEFLREVTSVVGVSCGRGRDSSRDATEMTVLLQGRDATGTMCISMRAKPYAKFVEVYGTEGIVHADLVREVCIFHPNRRLPHMISKAVFSLEDSAQVASGTALSTTRVALGRLKTMPGLRVLVREFYESIANNQGPPVPCEQARETTKIMEQVWTKAPRRPRRDSVAARSGRAAPRTPAERSVVEQGMPGEVLVTGATGFLGHRLVAALSRCGVGVVALVRDKGTVSSALEKQARLVVGDVRDPDAVKASIQGAAVVYHLAALTTNHASWASHYETNVRSSETLFREALKADVRRLIHVSSVIVYGLAAPSNGQPVAESTPCADSRDKWAHYMRAKIEAEKLAFALWREQGLPVTVLRPGILYGPGGASRIGGGMVQLGPLRLIVGTGTNVLPFTYVDNVVDCLLLAAISPQAVGQAFNVVDEPQVSAREVVTRRKDIAGEHFRLVPLPSALLIAVARLLEFNRGRNGSEVPPKLSRFVVGSACRNIRYDTTKAREMLGWVPTVSLEEGLRRTLLGEDVLV
jgi:predicted dehydrogenase/nucleoside-diphosphate-sugar epimerase